jgi:antirestriction protein ArdC
VQEQDDHESALDWRLEAELKSAEQRHKQAEAQLRSELAAAKAGCDKARAELKRQAAAAAKLQAEASNWMEVLDLKDREIQNLTAALGELSYESEAAERCGAGQQLQTIPSPQEAASVHVSLALRCGFCSPSGCLGLPGPAPAGVWAAGGAAGSGN